MGHRPSGWWDGGVFILYAIVGAIIVGSLAGGHVSRLGRVHLDWVWLALAGLLVQVALFAPALADQVGPIGPAVYIASTLAVVMFVARNRVVPGLPIVLVGAAFNLSAILANGGYMPADPGALAIAGRHVDAAYSNSVVTAHPALPWLTDIFALPPGLPFANVFSVGDVLIGLGIAWAIVATMCFDRSVPRVN